MRIYCVVEACTRETQVFICICELGNVDAAMRNGSQMLPYILL